MNNEDFLNSFEFIHKIINDYCLIDNYCGIKSNYLVHMLQGSARFFFDKAELFRIEPGDIVFIPKDCKYHSEWFANPNTKIVEYQLYVFFNFPDKDDYNYTIQKITPNKYESELILKLNKFTVPDCYSIGLFYQFFSSILPKLTFNNNTSQQSKYIKKAILYMEQHPTCRISEIAKTLRISESSLYSIFQKTTGKTPTEMRHKIVAEHAKTLLSTTDYTLDTICQELNLSSPSHLRKILSKQLGMTPKEIRKNNIMI